MGKDTREKGKKPRRLATSPPMAKAKLALDSLGSAMDDPNNPSRPNQGKDTEWKCKSCGCPESLTPVKRLAPDGTRSICNTCYIKLRTLKEKGMRGSARPMGGVPAVNYSTPYSYPAHPYLYPQPDVSRFNAFPQSPGIMKQPEQLYYFQQPQLPQDSGIYMFDGRSAVDAVVSAARQMQLTQQQQQPSPTMQYPIQFGFDPVAQQHQMSMMMMRSGANSTIASPVSHNAPVTTDWALVDTTSPTIVSTSHTNEMQKTSTQSSPSMFINTSKSSTATSPLSASSPSKSVRESEIEQPTAAPVQALIVKTVGKSTQNKNLVTSPTTPSRSSKAAANTATAANMTRQRRNVTKRAEGALM